VAHAADRSLEVLLDLDGRTLVVDPAGSHWVKVVVTRTGGRRATRKRGIAMTTLKVGIASYEEMKARTLAVARGERRGAPGEPKVWFTSTESFAKILSASNRALLHLIVERAPESLEELAQIAGRANSNLSRTLRTMEHYGLVRLDRDERGRITPKVIYDRVELNVRLVLSRKAG
jgi:predicted transcriptional regulator